MAPADILAYQDECRRTKKFKSMGEVKCIVLEAQLNANTPTPDVTAKMGVRMDWMNRGPHIAQTDGGMLMFESAVPPLPGMPDPNWKPTKAPYFGEDGKIVYDKPDLLPQPYEQFAKGKLKGTNLLAFEPVMQILVHPEGFETYWIIECEADQGTGTHMALLIDPATGAGYFYGGNWRIQRT
jgi:hypothetical protein